MSRPVAKLVRGREARGLVRVRTYSRDASDSGDDERRRTRSTMVKSIVSGRSNPVQVLQARAGKGAVFNYNSRRRKPEGDGALSDDAVRERRKHALGTQNRALPEQHTFSLPSSSFNASSWVRFGIAPPLAGRNTAGIGEGWTGRPIRDMRTALIMPGQGSQYITMARDLYDAFPSAREVWHQAEECITKFIQGEEVTNASAHPNRHAFETYLAQHHNLDAIVRSSNTVIKPGWFMDLVFRGMQLELTRAENAMPAILTATLSFLSVLRKDFGVDLVKSHMQWAAGHGSGIYAALVAAGFLEPYDALRTMRYRGLEAMKCLMEHPVLFPEGCDRPASLYETWAFANSSSGKGRHIVTEMEGKPPGWRGTQVSAVVVRPGNLERALNEVQAVQNDIREKRVPGIACDEFVEVSYINSQVQLGLSGTGVGVNYACDRLRFKGLGARAVNLPISGPYHTSFVEAGNKAFSHIVDVLPLREPVPDLHIVSSVNGKELTSLDDVRYSLRVALSSPVRWLDTISTLVHHGVKRFVCLGPSRAIAQQLSRELALRDRAQAMQASPDIQARAGTLDEEASQFEVWSITTAEGMEQFANALRTLPPAASS